MSDERPPASGFSWGLTPGGDPEKDAPAVMPPPAEPVNQGYFIALEPDQPALPATQSDAPPTSPPPAPEPPVANEDLPTQAISYDAPAADAPSTEQYLQPYRQPHVEAPTEILAAASGGVADDSGEAPSAIDALFGEERFQAYEEGIVQGENPFSAKAMVAVGAVPPSDVPPLPRAPMSRVHKTLAWVAGGLAAALALVGLFFAGTGLGDVLSPAQAAAPSPSPSPSALVPEVALGPVAPGVHAWDDLLGTECLEPYVSPWEEEFTVIDCATPHSAQLVYRGTFDDSVLDAYPGVDELQSRINLLCTTQQNVNYAAASQFTDIQVAASFAASEQEWIDGNRDYFCFVNRSSGQPFTVGVAMPARLPAVIPVQPEPEP